MRQNIWSEQTGQKQEQELNKKQWTQKNESWTKMLSDGDV